jgi:hypothetical protein
LERDDFDRQSLMVILLSFGDTAEIIDILGLRLSPESVLELLEREEGIVIDPNMMGHPIHGTPYDQAVAALATLSERCSGSVDLRVAAAAFR